MSITNKVIIELSEQLNNMSAESNSANDSVVDRLFDIMDKSSKKQKVDSEALQEGAVYIVGTTGAGKSTLLNYLAGKNLMVINDEGTIKLVLENLADGISSIGSGDGQSETIYPLTYRDAENEIAYIDNPGDQDSRGIAQQILNSYFKYNISRACPKLQILIVTSYSSMASENGTKFVEYLQTFAKSLENVNFMSSYISLVFTRVSRLTTVENALSKLQKMIDNQSTNLKESKIILENIVKEKKIGLFIEPSDDQVGKRYESPQKEKAGRQGILKMLKSGEYASIPETSSGLLKVTVSDTATIHKILANSTRDQMSLSNLIVSSIKSTIVQKVAALENVDAFLELDEDPLIKSGVATNTNFKKFFQEKLNINISGDYGLRKIEFFHRLLGEREFMLNFGSVNRQLSELEIKKIFNSEPIFDTSESGKIVLKGFNVKTSAFKKKALEFQGNQMSRASIQAINAIDFDEDLNLDVEFSIISPIWSLNKDKDKDKDITINLDGKSGANHAVSKALDGAWKSKAALHQNGEDGGAGTNGLPGNNGHHGGSFLGVGTKFVSNGKKLKISSNGGNGSKGQDGGNGGKGGDGGNEQDPTEDLPEDDYSEEYMKEAVENQWNAKHWKGGNGARGGDAGKGGQGGYAGKTGIIETLIRDNNCIEKTGKNGNIGGDGASGIPGNGGRNGNIYLQFLRLFNMLSPEKKLMKSNTWAGLGNYASGLVVATPQTEPSTVPHSEIINYEKFLASYFGYKDISRDIALEALKNFIKRSKPLEIDTTIAKLGLVGLIDEVQFLNGLYSDFLNQEEWRLSAKELISLYERSMVKVTEFGRTIPQNKVDAEVLLYLYMNIIMALNSLKPAYTVANFDYLEYFVKEKVVDYNQIVEREKIAASKKEYDQKIELEIENSNKWINKLNEDVDKLNEMLDQQVNGLKDDMKKSPEKKEEGAKQMKRASILKIASNVMKLIGGVVSCASQHGAAVDGLLSLGGTILDFQTPDLKPLSLEDLNPTTFLQLDDKEDKLIDTKKFIDILKVIYSEDQKITIKEEEEKFAKMDKSKVSTYEYELQKAIVEKLKQEVPSKNNNYAKKLMEDAAKDPSKFISDNCQQLDKRKEEAYKKLTEEQRIGLNILELEEKKLEITKYVTYISSIVQAANNIASIVQDCLAVQKQTEAAIEDLDDFKETQKSIRSFMDKSLQGVEKSVQGFANSLVHAESHAHIDFIRHGFKGQMQDVIDYFQSVLAKYEYSNGGVSKAHLFSVLNKFERLSETLANIQQRIADAEDKKNLANLITAVGEPNSDMTSAYPNILELSKSMQGHLLAKEGNDTLYSMKQSQFPIAPYYSYGYYKEALNLKDTEVNLARGGHPHWDFCHLNFNKKIELHGDP